MTGSPREGGDRPVIANVSTRSSAVKCFELAQAFNDPDANRSLFAMADVGYSTRQEHRKASLGLELSPLSALDGQQRGDIRSVLAAGLSALLDQSTIRHLLETS